MGRVRGVLKSTLGLSASTFLSRLLGFVREVLTAQYIGGGMLMSAWSYAFMIPNMFRRILGEGALGTALIPLISHTRATEGDASARQKFSTIILWLTFLLMAITVIVTALALLIEPFVTDERWRLALLAIPVVMPYCIMICLIGVATSLLNSLQVFFWPGMASLALNIFLIAALVFFCPPLLTRPLDLLYLLSATILLSGIVELLILTYLLWKKKMFPRVNRSTLFNMPAIREIWKLTLPGVFGMSALQIGMLSDQTLSMFISDYAKSALYYSERLIYLPIGIFAVAFGTVSLSTMSKLSAEKKYKTVLMMQFSSLRQLLFITIPIAVFFAVFGKELLSIVYLRGAFTQKALEETSKAMFWYSFGIPAFAALKVTLSGFYSRKDMMTPVYVSIGCIVMNILLSLILMFPMKQGGIALSTATMSYVNNIVLLLILKKTFGRMPLRSTVRYALGIVLLAVCAIVPSGFLFTCFCGFPMLGFLPKHLVPFCLASGTAGILYLLLSHIFHVHEVRVVTDKILNHCRLKTTR